MYAIENSNYFKSFVTLTFKANLSDINIANKIFQTWVRQVKRVYPEFMYLGVPEYQKRGAVHYHILTNIEVGTKLLPFQIDKNNRLYDAKYWNYGYSSAFDLKTTDDNFNIVYI